MSDALELRKRIYENLRSADGCSGPYWPESRLDAPGGPVFERTICHRPVLVDPDGGYGVRLERVGGP